MARPKEEGISYFTHDVKFNDDMETLITLHGNDALAVMERTWMTVYSKAHEIGVAFPFHDSARRKRLAEVSRVSEKKLTEIVESAVELGLFDKELFKVDQVLTSNRIKRTVERINLEREKARERFARSSSGGSSAKNGAKNERRTGEILNTNINSLTKERRAREENPEEGSPASRSEPDRTRPEHKIFRADRTPKKPGGAA
jgi:hypothetical protein